MTRPPFRLAGCVLFLTAGFVPITREAAAADARPRPPATAPAAPQRPPAASPSAPPSAADPATQLVAALRKPGLSADERKRLADQLLALGVPGSKRLAAAAAAEVDLKKKAYLTELEQAAIQVVTGRVRENGGQPKVDAEARALRLAALAVSRGNDLTKEAIQDKCDRAIKRLTELYVVTPAQAAERQPALKARRAEVLEWAQTYLAAAAKLPADQLKGLPPAPPTVEAVERDLAAGEQAVSLLGMPPTRPDRAVLLANLPVVAKLDLQEAAAVADVNRLRVLLGVGALAADPKLCDASRGHSKDMAEQNFFDHDSPILGRETPWQRAALAKTTASSENIFEGDPSGLAANTAWWYSPGHHKNLVAPAKRVGVGRHEAHFTQMFGM